MYMLMLMLCLTGSLHAQDVRPGKQVQKEAKRYERDGWHPAMGTPPIATQLAEEQRLKNETDSTGQRLWVFAVSSAIGDSQEMALAMAEQDARLDLANTHKVKVSSSTTITITRDKSTALTQSATQAKQSLRNTLRVMAICRQLADQRIEAQVCLGIKKEDLNNR